MIEAERIEQDLAATRARMDRRLDELQDRLSPSQIANEAFAYLQGSGGADVARSLIVRVRDNPIPFALTAVGIGWLMVSGQRRDGGTHEKSGMEVGGRGTGGVSSDGHGTTGAAPSPGDGPSPARGVKARLASATQTMREAVQDLQAGAGDIASRWSDASLYRAAKVREGSRKMYSSTRGRFQSATSSPVAIGALAVLAGIVAGALIPISEAEEAMLGSAAGRARAAGRGMVQDIVDRGADAAKDVVAAVKDSAEAHGLRGGMSTDEPIMASGIGDTSNMRTGAGRTSQPGEEVPTPISADI